MSIIPIPKCKLRLPITPAVYQIEASSLHVAGGFFNGSNGVM